ncbi:molybdenum cofactor biosynthesis protein MoaE [Candidatus Laterigemmans baculatus]|uniref:molybdenum cofactor biosynthesis protein MoaE n=1 Tax=Candidatus Laterigemmans baculatus TaxID=2770505 RepID=UPI0013DC8C02|nr:molybdenum cofactor biosynthesis protein MoaE [Candidatus Laterigemmans baculatus]
MNDGVRCRIEVALVESAIDCQAMLDRIGDDECGARMVFVGCTRRTTGQRVTERLAYEAYRAMAETELRGLAAEAAERWPLRAVAIEHRLGVVEVGQASVAVGVASSHRGPVMEAIPWLMDRLKERIPIWKQETYADGTTEWIHP